jgi:hypothetical protein
MRFNSFHQKKIRAGPAPAPPGISFSLTTDPKFLRGEPLAETAESLAGARPG